MEVIFIIDLQIQSDILNNIKLIFLKIIFSFFLLSKYYFH